MKIDFQQRRAVVTGAGKGIGLEIAKLLTDCNARVVAISRTQADLDALKSEIGCETIAADLASADEARAAIEKAGDVDLLVNNAGISILESFVDTSVDKFDRIMAVNVRALMIISQHAAKNMIARKSGGAIVNLSSTASQVGITDHTAYCTSKGAVDNLTRVMAKELGPHNIRVNAINPTVTLTPMGEMAWGDQKKAAPMLARIPLGRFAKPIDVAHGVAFLLSDYATMIHGVTLPIDGGFWSN